MIRPAGRIDPRAGQSAHHRIKPRAVQNLPQGRIKPETASGLVRPPPDQTASGSSRARPDCAGSGLIRPPARAPIHDFMLPDARRGSSTGFSVPVGVAVRVSLSVWALAGIHEYATPCGCAVFCWMKQFSLRMMKYIYMILLLSGLPPSHPQLAPPPLRLPIHRYIAQSRPSTRPRQRYISQPPALTLSDPHSLPRAAAPVLTSTSASPQIYALRPTVIVAV